jgi:hypothetical protein
MANHELFDRSPVRLVDKLTGGGLKAGEIALIAAKKGLGKTSVLVQFGVDYLLQDKQVVHVSFNQKSENVITWYEDVFTEIAKKKNISSTQEPLSELVKKRVILNFNQDVIALPRMIATVKALSEGGIKTQCLLIDDINFATISADDHKTFTAYAKEAGIFVCVSVTSDGETPDAIVPAGLSTQFDAVFRLVSHPDMIEVKCLNYKDTVPSAAKLRLDSKTLLITEK